MTQLKQIWFEKVFNFDSHYSSSDTEFLQSQASALEKKYYQSLDGSVFQTADNQLVGNVFGADKTLQVVDHIVINDDNILTREQYRAQVDLNDIQSNLLAAASMLGKQFVWFSGELYDTADGNSMVMVNNAFLQKDLDPQYSYIGNNEEILYGYAFA